jgi:hypothetical protein
MESDSLVSAFGGQATVLVLNRQDAKNLLAILVEADLSEAEVATDQDRHRLSDRLCDAIDVFKFGPNPKK